MTIKKILFSAIGLLTLFMIGNGSVSAATGADHVDTDGSLTGVAGATYYDVASWQDMFDTYQNVTPDASSNNTVYLNVTDDVAGSNAITTGVKLVSGKSVYIIGNGHTLYFDRDTNYTTGTNGQNASVGFYTTNSNAVSDTTNATLKNATWVNNRSSGIFPSSGSRTSLNQYFIDVTEYNGAANAGAAPINNEGGKIYFSGNNTFKVLYGNSLTATGTNSDTNFEWIRGGNYIEVLDGSTSVQLNANLDQMIYPDGIGTGQTIKINDNAKLNWLSGQYWSLYYGSATAGPLVWDLGKNAEFNISDIGTKSNTGRWFDTTNFNSWTVNADEGAKISADTAGGSINVDAINGQTSWNFGKNSELFLNNTGNGNLFTGKPASGSALNFDDVNRITMLSSASPVFASATKIPINITGGEGLRLHASSAQPADTNNISDTTNISGADLWARVATGSTDGGFTTASMSPTNYSSDLLKYMQSAKYLRWYHPDGLGVATSSLNRHFAVNLGALPGDGSWSTTIAGDDKLQLNFMDDRGQHPDFAVQVSQLSQATPNGTQYVWQNPDGTTPTVLDTNPMTLATITDDNQLPSYVTMTMAGGNYAFDYDQTHGLLLKANNQLKTQSNQPNATFRYAVVTGP
jgi:hypothetical protein